GALLGLGQIQSLHAVPRVGLGARAGRGEGLVQVLLEVAHQAFGLLLGQVAALDERLHVELAGAGLLVDERVHRRLGHRGVIALVVSATAVALHVDDHVALELLPVPEGDLGHSDAGLGIVTVDRKSTRLNSSHVSISYAVFCLKKKISPGLETVGGASLPRIYVCGNSNSGLRLHNPASNKDQQPTALTSSVGPEVSLSSYDSL